MSEQEKKVLTYDEDDGLSGYDENNPAQDMMDDEDECYYGCDFCLDSFLRDNCGCVGCEVITPKNDEQAKEMWGGEDQSNSSKPTTQET